MKYSVEKEIIDHPLGVETGHPAESVTIPGTSTVWSFLQYDLGNGLYVWRTPDQQNEVGRRGGGNTYYAKVSSQLLEASYVTLHSAMRAVAGLLQLYIEGRAIG